MFAVALRRLRARLFASLANAESDFLIFLS